MSEVFNRIKILAADGQWELTVHAAEKINQRGFLVEDIVNGLEKALVVEEYRDHHLGPSVLVLFRDSAHLPVHALWGMSREISGPAYIVTAYRPDLERWSDNYLRRRKT